MKYPFPGNVRELKALMDMAAVISDHEEIGPADLKLGPIRADNFFFTEETTMKNYNIKIIQHFLRRYDNNIVKVADKLDIGKSTIYKMIQQKEIIV